ncbi:MAG: hypothetical protein C0477_19820 [Delftia sp.]|nr:hypothetical protein [Delftia sp.]
MSKTETQSVALSLALLLRMQRDSASGVITHNAASRAAAELEWLDAENKALRGLAATCYAGLGAECNLPENWLDALNAAANGQAFDTEGLLPFSATEARDETIRQLEAQVKGAALSERERICAAIKAEDDYCVTQGDYMLDSDDCIKVARGEWERPVYEVEAAAKTGDAA